MFFLGLNPPHCSQTTAQLLKASINSGDYQKSAEAVKPVEVPEMNLTVLNTATKLIRKEFWSSRNNIVSTSLHIFFYSIIDRHLTAISPDGK